MPRRKKPEKKADEPTTVKRSKRIMEQGKGSTSMPPKAVQLEMDCGPSQESPLPSAPSPAADAALPAQPDAAEAPSTAAPSASPAATNAPSQDAPALGGLAAAPSAPSPPSPAATNAPSQDAPGVGALADAPSGPPATAPSAPSSMELPAPVPIAFQGSAPKAPKPPANDPTLSCSSPDPKVLDLPLSAPRASRPTFRMPPSVRPRVSSHMDRATTRGTRDGRGFFAEDAYPGSRHHVGAEGSLPILVTQPLDLTVGRSTGPPQKEQVDMSKALPLYKTAYIKDSFLGCDMAG